MDAKTETVAEDSIGDGRQETGKFRNYTGDEDDDSRQGQRSPVDDLRRRDDADILAEGRRRQEAKESAEDIRRPQSQDGTVQFI